MNADPAPISDHAIAGRPTLTDIAGWPAVVPVKQAATALGISKSTAYALIQSGDFPVKVVRLGGRYSVLTVSIVKLLSDSDDR